MPMTWDADADAKLFASVMRVYDVKISGSKLGEVARLMGDDCTAKAITHRLGKIKGQSGITTPSGKKLAAPRKSSTATATPSTSKRNSINKSNGKGKAKASNRNTDIDIGVGENAEYEDDEEDFEGYMRKEGRIAEKRGREVKGEDEDEDEDEDEREERKRVKVKAEPMDDGDVQVI